jgi:mono/diheme cytochrome c family protein
MFKRIVSVVEVVAVVGFVVMVGLLVLKQPTQHLTALPPRSSVPAGQTGVIAGSDGASLFRSNCAGCHGADGAGGIGPQLNGGQVTKSFSTAAAETDFITRGGGGMPAFRDQLSQAELQAIVEFTRTTLQSK